MQHAMMRTNIQIPLSSMAQHLQKDLTRHGRYVRFSWRNHEASDQAIHADHTAEAQEKAPHDLLRVLVTHSAGHQIPVMLQAVTGMMKQMVG